MNKTMIITGGSSGIGLAIAKTFVKAGYQVFNIDIVASNEENSGHFCQCDVSNHNLVTKTVNTIANALAINKTIDVAISNAGKHLSANIEDTSETALMDLFNLNVKGAFSLSQAVLPFMKQQQNGVILYMGSDQSTVAKPNSFAYNLTKHAIVSMAKTTAIDYARFNIRANALCPGTIDTPLYQNAISSYCEKSGSNASSVHAEEAALQPLNRIGKSSEVAALALFLAGDDAAFITGASYAIDGGYTTQ